MGKKLMVVDTDCGVDDALALVLALSNSEDWEVMAITCVAGNTGLDNVCQNVLRVLAFCQQQQIPVYSGCAKPLLSTEILPSLYHGSDGFGGLSAQFPTEGLSVCPDEHASNSLVRMTKENPGEITLVALGPLTNLAVAQRLDEGFGGRLKQLVIMGGTIEARGNRTPTAEFNFICDPEAAHVVISGARCPVTIVPLETCYRHGMTWDSYDRWVQIDTKKGKFVQQLTTSTVEWLRNKRHRPGFHCCDLLAMAVALNPDIVTERVKCPVDVELCGTLTRGMMVVDRRPREQESDSDISVVTSVDRDVMSEMYILMLQ